MLNGPCCNCGAQSKGIAESMEVLACKAMSSTMDHFALECVGGCMYIACRYMFEGVFVCVCFSVSVLDF